MPIVRVEKRETPFVVIDKTGLNDDRLSFKAKGLLAYLLTLPDGWNVNIKDLANRGTDGKDAVASGLAELQKFGYAEQVQARADGGEFARGSWVIYEVPKQGATVTGKTVTGKPGHGKSATTKYSTTEKPDTTRAGAYPEWFDRLWAAYPKMVKDRTNPKRGAFLKATGWLKKGYTEDDLIAAAAGYAASKPNPQYVQMAQTFYGPGATFEGFIDRGRGVDSSSTRSDTSLPAAKNRRVVQPEDLLDGDDLLL